MSPLLAGPALIAAAAALSTALPSAAQAPTPAPAVAKADPSDPKASVPPVTYRSAFAGYRPNVETRVGAWRDTNDSVGRIGGWRAYAKEAREAEAPAEGSKPTPPGPGGAQND